MKVWLFFLVFSLLGIQSNGQFTEEDGTEVIIDTWLAGLAELPVVGTFVKVLTPAARKLLEMRSRKTQDGNAKEGNLDEASLKALQSIQKGMSETRSIIMKSLGEIKLAIDLHIVKEVQSEAGILMNYLNDITLARNSSYMSSRIDAFLKQCEKNDPYHQVMKLAGQISIALRSQLQYDVYHSKKNLDTMKRKLNSILNELIIVDVFRMDLSENISEEDRLDNIHKWDQQFKQISNDIRKDYEELLSMEYWHKIDEFFKAVMHGHAHSDVKTKANQIEQYLFDIHTNDRFCVVTRRYRTYGIGGHIAYAKMYATNETHYSEDKEYFIEFFRSRTAHNLTSSDIAAFHNSVDSMQNVYRLYWRVYADFPFKDHGRYAKDVQKHHYSAILTYEETPDEILKCDSTVTYTTAPINCDAFVLGRWLHPDYIVHAMPL